MAEYTTGETRALLAPLFRVDSEEIEHFIVIACINDGETESYATKAVGCDHALQIIDLVRNLQVDALTEDPWEA